MPIATDANILYAHYLAGRYPAAVSVEMPETGAAVIQDGARAAQLAEICAARARGASHQDHPDQSLPAAAEVARWVSALLHTHQGAAVPAAETAGVEG